MRKKRNIQVSFLFLMNLFWFQFNGSHFLMPTSVLSQDWEHACFMTLFHGAISQGTIFQIFIFLRLDCKVLETRGAFHSQLQSQSPRGLRDTRWTDGGKNEWMNTEWVSKWMNIDQVGGGER